ncbi:MAG TPA: hypothetical protein PL182_07555 [Pseudobdellovibrionaceae bacterium]|nr:hypothetical protein [Pseudobdellovibrionaceae bacterium]
MISLFLVGLSSLLAFAFGEAAIRVLKPLSTEERKAFQDEMLFVFSRKALSETGSQTGVYMAHPFWGYQGNPSHDGVNNFGFVDPEDFPYRKRAPHEVVVGLFGGSVALHTSTALREELSRISGPSCSFKLLNFALEGFRQPSQFNAAHAFLESLDLTVNLDGSNEIMAYHTNDIPENYPEFYPQLYQLTDERRRVLEQAHRLRRLREFNAGFFSRFPRLLNSELFIRIGLTIDRLLEEKRQFLFNDMNDSLPFPAQKERRAKEAKLRAALDSWEKYSSSQNLIAKSRGKVPVFFIQPSQYGPDPKPMNETERKTAIDASDETADELRKRFAALRTSGRFLRKMGLPLHDLISFFSSTEEEIFSDTCCHLNKKGTRLLAVEMARIIGEEAGKTYCLRRKKDGSRRISSSFKNSQ